MADQKITDYTANTTPALADLIEIVDDPGGTPASQKITLQNLRRQLFPYAACGGRLTLTTATPVTTADVTGATTLYFTPYSGSQFCGQVGLYDGSAGWDVLNFPELSLSLVGYTASKPYDIWIYNNSGTPTLDSTIWTDGTTRATALALQNGVYVKTGATTRRYLGTIYINSSGGQTDDAVSKRFVWNYYNRVLKTLYRFDGTGHTYATDTVRAWNNDATNNVLPFIIGVVENRSSVSISGYTTVGAASRYAYVLFGYDATNASALTESYILNAIISGNIAYFGSTFPHLPTAGYHYYSLLESASASCTFTYASLGVSIWG